VLKKKIVTITIFHQMKKYRQLKKGRRLSKIIQ
jgi:hypothetical protein